MMTFSYGVGLIECIGCPAFIAELTKTRLSLGHMGLDGWKDGIKLVCKWHLLGYLH
jgi:hypothetical protein